MALDWTLADIRTKVRKLTGKISASQMSDDDIDDTVNDFYQRVLPTELQVADLQTWYTFNTASGDGGEYDLAETALILRPPFIATDADDVESGVKFYQDKTRFFELYPESSHDEEAEENTPAAVLLYGKILYLRPKADAVYTIKCPATEIPDALVAGASPLDKSWGRYIAYGTAILIIAESDPDGAAALGLTYEFLKLLLNRPLLIQKAANQRARPRW